MLFSSKVRRSPSPALLSSTSRPSRSTTPTPQTPMTLTMPQLSPPSPPPRAEWLEIKWMKLEERFKLFEQEQGEEHVLKASRFRTCESRKHLCNALLDDRHCDIVSHTPITCR
ncbi:hypothetical protein SCLCIDRAFT_28274 [Scleroderma citrinum Foug A]|uniref:Uncharacterized protein n=1 Tax=Scleroderma citrinum Foug A TaxID=1036808 RepID=A0A0C2Z848_9AGAM|nr:hypothetical protein SCLCIDRAFT_28274 [Scleroderma citrinum Foug A]